MWTDDSTGKPKMHSEAMIDSSMPRSEPPLIVDLDGSLIRSDMLLETLVAALRRAPYTAFAVPVWLLFGRANLKARLAERVGLAPEHLPYRQDVLEWLASERNLGRRIVLATASDERVARSIAGHLGLFDEVIASTPPRNLKGEAKRRELVARFGEGGFDYAGDSRADLPSWRAARRAILLVDDEGLKAAIGKRAGGEVEVRPPPGVSRWRAMASALRVHQWSKNLLVLVPLFTAHRVADSTLQLAALLAFLAFSLAASAVYVINDLADLDLDRRNSRKRGRAFASGELSLAWGFVLAPLLLAAALALASQVATGLCLAIAAYAAASIAYTLLLKRIAILDVIVLAGLYTLRIIAGALAIDVEVSQWLLAFSMFIFLSLALAKRHVEIASLRQEGADVAAPGRGYRAGDLEAVATFGASSAFVSLLILALYVSSQDVLRLYGRPAVLWLLVPVMLYWIARVWLLAWRQELHEDPVVFALHDPASYAAGVLCGLVVFAAT
jgi:4-hydroxybenzoate polyprenyltransferase/phosphoserine phosphatase